MQDIAAENRGKVTAYVGAGGKTSSIRKRAETLRAEGKRVLILTTTKMMVPQEQEIFAAYEQTGQESVISATASVWQERRAAEKQLKERVQSVLDTYGCCVAGSLIPGTEKFGMLPEKLMEDLLYLADEILIEADGSAHMPVKAPAEHEPVLFPYMDEVVIVMGAHAIGKPLQEVCHRADYAKKILKCDADKIVTATDIRVLAEQGYAIPIQKQFPWMKISKVTGKDIKLCLTAEKKDKERDKQ
ncbi:selenium cofactor biosynthesis protein YqeC [Roseburia inulinivorans]|uniref:selenium cofactor biosynthesis protein YqeC n=1 Tax=Roseburia inulinivorans TaxID=360807 RepID=UPI00241FAE52|nr:selenium cofactor biosynthesis protein YqeC [Roseburia inulinivorans]